LRKPIKEFRQDIIDIQASNFDRNLIYRCSAGHVSFAKDLRRCGMKGCELSVDVISEHDIDWFYKINPDGLAINEKDLNQIVRDKNMPEAVKNEIRKIFPQAMRKKRFWFG
jgi:hypothetical protein